MGLFSKLFKGNASDAPAIRYHEAFGGSIRIMEAPTAPEWRATEDQQEGDGFIKIVLKYIFPDEPMPTILYAKMYVLHEDLGAPPDPSSTDWSVEFDTLFAHAPHVVVLATRQMLIRGDLPATEAVLDGESRAHALPMRIRERRATLGQRQFILTAIGPVTSFTTHEQAINAWFETTAFDVEEDA
jgi:hypothetical protein